MKANEIRVGGVYIAKVSGKLTKVRVDAIRETSGRMGRGERTVYGVTNLATKRTTSFRSAAKFRKEVKGSEVPVPKSQRKTESVVSPEYPMPKAKVETPKPPPPPVKAVVARVHAGGGIMVDIVEEKPRETPEQAMTRVLLSPREKAAQQTFVNGVSGILNGTTTDPQVLKDINTLIHPPRPKKVEPTPSVPAAELLTDEEKQVVAKRRSRVLAGAAVGERVRSLGSSEVATVKSQLPGMAVVTVGGREETWSPGTEIASGTETPCVLQPPAIPSETRQDAPKPSKKDSPRSEPSSPRVAPVKLSLPKGAEAMSNKEIVYRKWLETIEADVASLAALVPEVALSSVKSWTSAWGRGTNLPKVAKDLPPSLRGKVKK